MWFYVLVTVIVLLLRFVLPRKLPQHNAVTCAEPPRFWGMTTWTFALRPRILRSLRGSEWTDWFPRGLESRGSYWFSILMNHKDHSTCAALVATKNNIYADPPEPIHECTIFDHIPMESSICFLESLIPKFPISPASPADNTGDGNTARLSEICQDLWTYAKIWTAEFWKIQNIKSETFKGISDQRVK